MLVASFLPAVAEDAGLKNGAAALDAGKYENAVRMLSSTINSDNATPADAAKALYLRGIAYRKLGQPARAIADLGAAMFLGLPEEDRVKALVNRGLAYQAAGLASQGEAEIAQARKAGGGVVDQLIAEGGGTPGGAASIAAFSTSVTPEQQGFGSNAQAAAGPETAPRDAGASGQWTTTASAESGGESGSGGGNRVSRWWGALTGSSSSVESASAPAGSAASPGAESSAAKAPPAPSTGWTAQTEPGETVAAAAPPAPSGGWGAQTQTSTGAPSGPPPAQSPPPKAPSTGWTTQTQGGDSVVASDAAPAQSRWSRWFSRTAEADQAVPPQPAAATATGGFQVQLANSRSEAEAQALWKQVSGANAALAGKSPQIEKVDIGNFGTFYSLKAGPFPDKAESTKVCNALKRNGVDCLVVSSDAQ